MCYLVYLSTTSTLDLSEQGFDNVSFVGPSGMQPSDEVRLASLKYPNKWFVSTHGGCSCYLRHFMEPEELFGQPVDWYPEDAEHIASTGQLYDLLCRLLEDGAKVDLVDVWEGSDAPPISHEVVLSSVPRSAFRLVEDVHMDFSR